MKKFRLFFTILGAYLRTYVGTIALCLALSAIFPAVHLLGFGSMQELSYALLIAGCLLLAVFLFSFPRYVAHWRLLRQAADNPPPEPAALPPGLTPRERMFRELALSYGEEYRRQADAMHRADQERTDYYTLWMHQIKTPIAALNLIAQSEAPVDREQLRQELFKIEQYADVALSFQRLRSIRADLDLMDVPLYPLCCKVVRRLRPLFLYRKISLVMQPFEGSALSDAKWLALVLEQVLTNSLKYTPEGGAITVSLAAPQVLTIADTGIGIRPEDVPRVFDRGFTGYIGRAEGKSTGIGLYLCRQVCSLLGHRISLTSGPNLGTTVTLNLRRDAFEAF